MISVIISGHGELATALKDSSEMIFGEVENLVAIPFFRDEGTQTLQNKFKEVLEGISEENEVLFLVDIFGGTPYNAASMLAYNSDRIDVGTGVNLPILLEALSMRGTLTLNELVKKLKQVSEESFQVCSDYFKELGNETEDTEEDLL